MHLKKRFLMLALAAIAASFVAVPSASALEMANCTFTGLAGNLTPPIAPAPTTGGAGTYDFSGTAASCSYVNSATGTVVPNTTATITSRGRYENDVCGTGRAFGETATGGTVINFADPAIEDINQVDYRIDFAGGNGALRGGELTTKPNGSPGTVNNEAGWRATGAINIRPANSGGCVVAPVSAFNVTGNFKAMRP